MVIIRGVRGGDDDVGDGLTVTGVLVLRVMAVQLVGRYIFSFACLDCHCHSLF